MIEQVDAIDPDPSHNHIRPFSVPTSTFHPAVELEELFDNLDRSLFVNRLIYSFNPFTPCDMDGIISTWLEPYLDQVKSWDIDPIPVMLTEVGCNGAIDGNSQSVASLNALALGKKKKLDDRKNRRSFVLSF